MPALDAVLEEKIASMHAQHRLRAPTVMDRAGHATHVAFGGKSYVSFSSNDYLGLAMHPDVTKAAAEAVKRYGGGSGASRLITGTHPLYDELEAALAEYKGAEAALVFGSGYLTNIGVIPALVGRDDLVVADKLVHACIIDGIKLSGAKLLRFAHNDTADCERLLKEHRAKSKHCLLISETVFSMDGDRAPLIQLAKIAKKHDAWLMTDDAHGVGEGGKGNPAQIQMGTLSKALGSYGGYVCGSETLIRYLQSAARSFIYSTALPPAAIATGLAALKVIATEPQRADQVMACAKQFTQTLGLPGAQSPIVPLLLGKETTALEAMEALKEAGFLVVAIRPPTVPEGTARLRFSFSAAHTEDEVLALCDVIQQSSWFEGVADACTGT